MLSSNKQTSKNSIENYMCGRPKKLLKRKQLWEKRLQGICTQSWAVFK